MGTARIGICDFIGKSYPDAHDGSDNPKEKVHSRVRLNTRKDH